jgi:NTP pyrophosphatase (non-canonical NTP hydrolase)
MKNWQTDASKFAQKHNLSHATGVYVLDLVSEVGEVAKEILKATQYGSTSCALSPENQTEDLAGELGDVLYSLCMLAESAGINLDTAFTQTLEKYEQRWQNKGEISSAIRHGEDGEQL